VVTPPGFLPGFRPAVLLEKRASEALWSHHLFDESHDGVGWSGAELDELERRGEGHGLHAGIVINGQQWTLHCDSFCLDMINLFRRLTADAAQMQGAEYRFSQGVYNWRRQ
jgi:hypothetical protein